MLMPEDWVWSLFACPGPWKWSQLLTSSQLLLFREAFSLQDSRGKVSGEVRQRKKSNPFFSKGWVAELVWEVTVANSAIWFILDPHLSWSCVTVN